MYKRPNAASFKLLIPRGRRTRCRRRRITHHYNNNINLFQSKLNCEVLYDDLAFEARWAVAGDSIVLQLVAKLGKSWAPKSTLSVFHPPTRHAP